MKKISTFLTLICFISLTQTSFGQDHSNNDITLVADKVILSTGPKFECNQIVYNDKTQIMTLIDNVSMRTDKFEFEKAGKVVYNQKTKKLTIYDCKGFTIDGKVITKSGKKKINIVEYIIGDDTAYLL
jgi:lipopolysaccharide assembly outer membrane protein LptD (OstA)